MKKIISGGQTGVDLAGVDFARLNGIDWGGYVPLGRRNENGILPVYYDKFIELPTPSYKARTYANVEAADFTLIVVNFLKEGSCYAGKRSSYYSPGTNYTLNCLKELDKWDHFLLIGTEIEPFEERSRCLAKRLKEYDIVNIAGTRESKSPGIYEQTLRHLQDMWKYY